MYIIENSNNERFAKSTLVEFLHIHFNNLNKKQKDSIRRQFTNSWKEYKWVSTKYSDYDWRVAKLDNLTSEDFEEIDLNQIYNLQGNLMNENEILDLLDCNDGLTPYEKELIEEGSGFLSTKEIDALLCGIGDEGDDLLGGLDLNDAPKCSDGIEITPELIEDVWNEENNNNLESKEEQKPKFEDFGDYYVILSTKRNLRITKDEVRRLKNLYCVRGMNINQVCLEMDMLRDEFFLVKNAFSIVKTDQPFIDEDVDKMTPEEMAEHTRREKKRTYFRKLEEKKVQDMEFELKKMMQRDYYYRLTIEKLQEIKYKEPEYVGNVFVNHEKEAVLFLSDLHIGMKHESPFNTFNFEVARQRLKKIIDIVIQKYHKNEFKILHIVNLGDDLHGNINTSGRITSEANIIECVKILTEMLLDFITTLIKDIPNINYYAVSGNHSRISEDKKASLESETFSKFVTWYLELATREWNRFNIIQNRVEELMELDIFDKHIVAIHGHEGASNKIKDLQHNWYKKISEIHKGHVHHQKTEEFSGLKIYTSSSFCGVDDYAKGKLLYSKPMQMLHIYEKSGDKEICEIYL